MSKKSKTSSKDIEKLGFFSSRTDIKDKVATAGKARNKKNKLEDYKKR